ncbi:phytoene desaturase family protein [Novosphingobium sp.]|uniref:phytoene desaturase family protein n=1 Tax=Novosphingobium sp. TaxID=1874826 RepID=UPI00333F212D
MPDQPRPDRPHAVVIGSGFGGLAAAIRLGARGYRVTVLERLDSPGGRAGVFRQDGFVFDAGPTIITTPYLFEELWALCGQQMSDHIDLRRINPFYTMRFDDGSVFRASADPAAMRAEVARFEPADVAGLDRYFADSKTICKVAFDQLADQPFDTFGALIKSAPDLVRLGGYRTVYQHVCRYFRNDKLRMAFSFQPLLIGGNPLSTTAYYALVGHLERQHGVHYALGGTGALVAGLVRLIAGQGGSLRLNADVVQITASAGRATGVTLAGGEHIAADVVVSNADVGATYTQLLAGQPRRRWTDRKIAQMSTSMGMVVWHFGSNRRFDGVGVHTMVMGPRYQGLLRDVFTNKVLPDDTMIYLHRATAADPALAPDGCDTFYAAALVPNLASGTDWGQAVESYRARIQARLEATLLPGLGDSLVTSHVQTPLDFQDRYRATLGSAFSIEPRLFQTAWFRPHNRSEDLAGLYLVGAGTHPGPGVPGALSSARILDTIVPDARAGHGPSG